MRSPISCWSSAATFGRVLGRRPDRLKEFVRRGAETAIGSQDDADYLVKATRGVDALFWATPPGYGSDNVRAFQNRLGRAAATAIRTNRIPRVVNLSSIGAQLGSGVGPINGLHDVEGLLNDAATHITHLRPGFFFENLLWQLDPIRKWGRSRCRFPAIATLPDVGHPRHRPRGGRPAGKPRLGRALRRRVARSGRLEFRRGGRDPLGRPGPEDRVRQVRSGEARQAMLESAMSENAVDLMLEMYEAVETGRLRPIEPRSAQTTTPTTLAEFARETILPLVAEPVTS